MAAQREAEQLAEALETRRKQNSIIVAKQEEENRRFEYIKLRDTSVRNFFPALKRLRLYCCSNYSPGCQI